MKAKELIKYLSAVPSYEVVLGEASSIDEDYSVRVDMPIGDIFVDTGNKEVVLFKEPLPKKRKE